MSENTIPVAEIVAASASRSPVEEPETPTIPLVDPDLEADPQTDPKPDPDPAHEPIQEPEPDPEDEPDADHAPIEEPPTEPSSSALSAYQAEPSTEPVVEAESDLAAAETEPVKVEPAKVESARPEVTKPGATKPEATKFEPATPEPAKPEPAKPEPATFNAEVVEEPEEESFADIFSEFNRTHTRRAEGASQIRGTVVAVTAESVLVDIGYKSEGILPLTAFPVNRETGKQTVAAGDALQVSVKGRDVDGYYELSLFKTAQPKDWTSLEKAFEEKATIVGTVTAVVKGGLHVDVGIRAFLPASRSGARDAAEMEKLIGEEIRVRITKLDVADEDLVVDRRVVTEEEALESKGRRFAEMEEGAVVNATVRSLADYGAFLDIGGVDGLLHISDISWSRVANVADVLTVGQQMEVKILKIDPDTHRIALGLKQLQEHPWDAVAAKYTLGDRVKGVVSRIADFGAFVELEPGVDGLVHLSEMSYTKRILKATEVVKLGDVVDAVILAISVPERRISLGLKQALGDPWVDAATRLSVGSVIEGPVASITKFGAFVTVSEGVQGLVHISEIVADKRLNHPSDVLHSGQVVRALVLEMDKEKRQLKLSMKQLIPTGLDEFISEHRAGDTVTGRVVSVEESRARVELGEGIFVSCLLPKVAAVEETPMPSATSSTSSTSSTSTKVDLSAFSSMLKTKWKTGGESGTTKTKASAGAVAAGQVRSFRITQMDVAAKLISLEFVP